RKRTHCARRIFLNPRTGPGTRCDLGQKGHTKRVPCAFGMRSTITDHPSLHNLYSTGSSGAATTFAARTGFAAAFGAAARFGAVRFGVRFAAALRIVLLAELLLALRAARLLPLRPDRERVARIVFALAGPLCHHRPAHATSDCSLQQLVRPVLLPT